MPRLAVLSISTLLILVTVKSQAFAAESTSAVRISNPQRQVWKLGLEITGGDGSAFGVVATAPIPHEWPEQQIKIINQETTGGMQEIGFRKLGDGARQMVVEIPHLAAGETARAILAFEITRSFVDGPSDPDLLQVAKRPDRSLRTYLAPSPLIESSHTRIRSLAAEITQGKQGGWRQAEAIFDWVRKNVTYQEGSLKGAMAALRDGNGDCEEMASLFIALCRASKIPARTVWVPDHCYCEFLLHDAEGNELWIPCDATRNYPFGSVHEPRIILQKGDNFFMPELRQRVRYAQATLKVANLRGRTQPTIKYIRQQVE